MDEGGLVRLTSHPASQTNVKLGGGKAGRAVFTGAWGMSLSTLTRAWVAVWGNAQSR